MWTIYLLSKASRTTYKKVNRVKPFPESIVRVKFIHPCVSTESTLHLLNHANRVQLLGVCLQVFRQARPLQRVGC